MNQVAKVAPGVVKAATNDINNVGQDRINQIISQGGKEVERVFPKILRETIEDVYQTPFRLLRNFGKQQLNKIKRKILHYTFIPSYYFYSFTIIIYINQTINNKKLRYIFKIKF